ncbi:MAG: right-handed parallel beta-helix repeat-containing protein, partial [Promethearchaeota archaeon]
MTISSDVPNSQTEFNEFTIFAYFPPDQDSPRNSDDFIESPIAIDALATGVGAHNWTWAVSQPWCSGTGTPGNPYIIENVTIDAVLGDYGISISHSEAYFIIQNCAIDNAGTGSYDAGIYFVNVSNGRITQNVLDNNYRAILLRDFCENNSISLNNITGMATSTSDLGIYIYNQNSNISITENRINSVNYGIYLYSNNDFCVISQNTISLISHSGIHLNYNCDFNTISENDISDCSYHGIYLANTNLQNFISQNTVYLNDQTGIFVQTSNFNNITFNQLESDIFGLRVHDSTGCVLLNNSMVGTGMGLTADTYGLTDFYHPIVENNTVNGKKIYYYYEKANLTSMNFTNAAQIYLIRCNDSEIVGFTFSGKDYGAAVVQCLNITIFNNTFSNH